MSKIKDFLIDLESSTDCSVQDYLAELNSYTEPRIEPSTILDIELAQINATLIELQTETFCTHY